MIAPIAPIPGVPDWVYCDRHGSGGRVPWTCHACAKEDTQAARERLSDAQRPRRRRQDGKPAEDTVARILDALGVAYKRQYHFAASVGRRYRADFALLERRLLIEVEGQPHAIRGRREADCERSCIAAALGWRMARVSARQVRDGAAEALIRQAVHGMDSDR